MKHFGKLTNLHVGLSANCPVTAFSTPGKEMPNTNSSLSLTLTVKQFTGHM